MRARLILRPSRVFVMVAAATALLGAVVLSGFAQEYTFSDFDPLNPPPDCQPMIPPAATPMADLPGPTPTPAVPARAATDLDLSIEAFTNLAPESPLRLYTRSYTRDAATPDAAANMTAMNCQEGIYLLYVVSGRLLLTVSTDPSPGPQFVEGHVAVSALVPRPIPTGGSTCANDCEVAPGESVELIPGDAAFLDEAWFSLELVGDEEALLLVSSVAPEELPCSATFC